MYDGQNERCFQIGKQQLWLCRAAQICHASTITSRRAATAAALVHLAHKCVCINELAPAPYSPAFSSMPLPKRKD